ncbi:hypothetical protein C8R44DRAFT_880994 [Mycena epipterygia]|nr:hypothetical protein C8R44DRAFT_880994 [Mycena epipterygia]
MTEYDYSPEAVDRYMQTQSRIQHWTQVASRSQLCDPDTPPTPAFLSKGLPKSAVAPQPIAYNTEPSPGLATHTKPSWAHKKHDVLRRIQASSGDGVPPALTVHTPAVPPAQVYNYTQQTNRYGSQLNITAQTSNGVYVQQHSYQQTTRPIQLTPQTLEVPPVNYAPLAQNPYPAPEHFRLPGPEAPLVSKPRVRAKSSGAGTHTHSVRGGGMSAPPVPPMPMPQHHTVRPRAHSSVRPPGAAPPLQPSNGVYANGLFTPAPAPTPPTFQPSQSVSSLALPAPYPYTTDQHSTPYPAGQYPVLGMKPKSKSKSSATLKSKYAAQAQRPRVEDMPPGIPASQTAQLHFYTAPRAAKSSATLYAEPRAAKSSATLYAEPRRSRRHRDVSTPEFGESPAASQMLMHSQPYHDAPAPPRPTLFKRMFGRKNT